MTGTRRDDNPTRELSPTARLGRRFATPTGGLSEREQYGGSFQSLFTSAAASVIAQHCDPDLESVWRATDVVWAWAGGDSGEDEAAELVDGNGNPVESPTSPDLERLLAMPEAERKAWRGRFLAASRNCDELRRHRADGGAGVTTQVVAGSSGRLSGRHRARRRVLPWPLLVLYMRARQLGWFALGLTVVALVGWWAAQALLYGDVVPDPDRRVPVAAAAPLLAAVLASIGLGGADEELERTTAWRWREARAGRIVAATLLAVLALASIGTWEPAKYAAQVIVRNVLGCFGVVAFSTVIFGARLAWAPLFGYVATVDRFGAVRTRHGALRRRGRPRDQHPRRMTPGNDACVKDAGADVGLHHVAPNADHVGR
jgi:hypothetical protein